MGEFMATRVILSNKVMALIERLSEEDVFKIVENDDINICLTKILTGTNKLIGNTQVSELIEFEHNDSLFDCNLDNELDFSIYNTKNQIKI